MDNQDIPLIFPEKVERHENCKPPREAYFFIPTEDDKVLFDSKDVKSTRRKIFEIKEDYLEFERFNLDLLKDEIQNLIKKGGNELKVLNDWKDAELLRFHQSTSYNVPNTLKLLNDHLAWKKKSIFPLKINENVLKILNSGFIYVHGRDNHYRPIIVTNAQIYLTIRNDFEFEDFVTAIIYFIEYIIKYMLIPGQVENWNIIANVHNVSIMSIPDTLMKIFKILQSNYRARLNVVYIVGMSAWLNALWILVKSFIDPGTNKKIRFIRENAKYEIFEFINSDQVEIQYGGLAKNVDGQKDGYFPPIIPNNNFLKQNDVREYVLMSEERYVQLYYEGKLTQVSPYMIDKIKNRESSNSKYEVDSYYEDAKSYLDIRLSPAPQKGRPSLDLRSNKSISLMNYSYNRINASPYLPESSLRRNIKNNNTFSKKIGHSSRRSCDNISIYENCKDLSNINLNYSRTNISKLNPKLGNNDSEYEEEYEIKNVKKDVNNLMKSGSSKRDSHYLDNIESTTKDTKDNRGEMNYSSNKYKSNSEGFNNSNYNTNYLEENEIKNVKSSTIQENKSKEYYKNGSKMNFKVSEFDANIGQNYNSVYDDCKNPSHKFHMNSTFPLNSNKGSPDIKKENDKVDHVNPSEYITLETNAKDFCCSSKNTKCLIF